MTPSALFSLLAVAACFAILLVIVSRMLLARRRHRSTIENPVADSFTFDVDKYRPMARLLEDDDLLFLKSQPGFRPEMGRTWKAEHRRIFRLYLGELKRDFRSLHAQARRLVAEGTAESAELVATLVHQRWMFLRATFILELRLAMLSLGVGHVDVSALLELLESIRVELQRHSLPQAV